MCQQTLAQELENPPAGDGTPSFEAVDADRITAVRMELSDGGKLELARENGNALLRRTGLPDRVLPLVARPLGEELAEELPRLDGDQPYAAALAATTGAGGLDERSPTRVHVWKDPALAERPETADAPARAAS